MSNRRLLSSVGLGALMTLVGLSVTPVGAQSDMGMQTGDLKISTASTDYNINSGNFVMPHHVSATRPGTQIDGDHAFGNGKQRTVTIEGHVLVRQNGGTQGKSGSLFGDLNSGDASHEPSTLTTNKLTVELGSKVYTADGNVKYVQGLRTVTADHGVLDDGAHILHLTGHVHVDDTGHTLSAESVDYNTVTDDVHAKDNVQITVPVATAAPAAPGVSPAPRRGHGRR